MEPENDLLVILDPDRAADALERLRSVVTITQILEPRIALISPRGDSAALTRDIEGVVRVVDADEVPDAAALRLTDQETMFVEAWRLRKRPKRRAGEGLPWDTPGFQPPDPPTS